MNNNRVVYLLVIVWAVVFAASVILTVNIEGPRNIDTGFRRLDTLARGQIVAFLLALVTAAAAFIVPGGGKRLKLVGLVPLGLTILIVAGIFIFALIMNTRPAPQGNTPPPRPVTAEPAPVAPAKE